jgi:hypothetical protein
MGFFGGNTSVATGWQAPTDWPSLNDCALGNIEMIVNDQTMATYAFVCTTSAAANYQINWGDGNTIQYASGATAQHTYTVGSGTPCSLGYTTFKITISPVSGNLTAFAVAPHSLAVNIQYHAILSAYIRATSLASLASAFYCATGAKVYCRQLENCVVQDAMPSCLSATSMFTTCYSLQSVNVSGMTAVTTATSMFTTCYSLQSVNVSGMTAVTTATSMFNACTSLQSVNVSGMTAVTTATNMFTSCYSLQSVNVSGMTAVTTATSMFTSCYSLSTVTMTSFASAAASLLADTMFSGCEQMINILLPTAKVTKLGMAGATGLLDKLATISFNAASTFSGTSPQLDVSYCTLTAAQLNTIFGQLPNNLAKTVNITGCTGETLVTLSGTTVLGSTTVTMASTAGLSTGMEMTGTGINTAQAVTTTVSTSVVNLTAHGIPNGTLVYFPTLNNTTGITVNTPYFVVNAATNTFQVSLTSGGAAITFGGTNATSATVFYGNTIQAISPNVSVTLLIPASSANVGESTVSSVCLHSLAAGKGWTITG